MGMTEFLLVVAVGGGIIAVLLTTFRGAASDADAEAGAAGSAEIDEELVELDERHRALLRSMDEIESDYEAGNLSEDDYRSLHARYEKEAASLGRQLESADREVRVAAATAGQSAPGGSRMTGAIGWAAGAVAFVALAWLVMSQALSPRGPDGIMTGSLPGQEMGSGATTGMPIAEVDMGRLSALERMVAEDSTNVEALVELGHLYLTLQDYPNVTTVSMMVLDLEPDNPGALTHLGMVLMSVEHVSDAMATFDRALEADPTFGEALQFKGMVAFMSRDYPTAVAAWERYVEVVPEEEQAPRVKAMLGIARANAEESQ